MNIAFDFDGALVDSFGPLYEINRLGAIHVGKTISEAEYRVAFKGPIHQELKRMLKLTDEEDTEFRTHKRAIFLNHYNSNTIFLHPFVKSLITELAKDNHLSIVSAAPEKNVFDILRANDLAIYFWELRCGHVAGKREILKELLGEDDVFVTDTAGDIREANELKSEVIGVTWGFHDKMTLFEAEAKHVIITPEALRIYLTSRSTVAV